MSLDEVANPSPDEQPAPTVFISYSYDSVEHKMWVAGLARNLRERGIDAILDQWEIGPGKDVQRFMEIGIRNAKRVCIVCTPEYGRKADAGEGGVGYEKMIVTGQLYEDLGTGKFVPLLVRGDKEQSLPTFLRSRLYIDFRKAEDYEDRLVELVHELHEVPRSIKPPLGPSPFGAEQGHSRQAGAECQTPPIPLTSAPTMMPEKVYETCQGLIRRGDLVGWRQLAKVLRRTCNENLMSWRQFQDANRPQDAAAFRTAIDGALGRAMPVMAMAIAGVESGVVGFTDQRHFFDDLVRIEGWPRNGLTVLVELPRTLGYVFHYLYGAIAAATSQIGVALSLATMTVMSPNGSGSVALWRDRELTSYPHALDGNCAVAWKFLASLPATFPWIESVFETRKDFRIALCAYSMLLSALELGETLRRDGGEKLILDPKPQWEFEVIPLFAGEDMDILSRAFQMAFRDATAVRTLAEFARAKPEAIRKTWPKWMEKVGQVSIHFGGGWRHFHYDKHGLGELPQ